MVRCIQKVRNSFHCYIRFDQLIDHLW
jgi:hypothetical protein